MRRSDLLKSTAFTIVFSCYSYLLAQHPYVISSAKKSPIASTMWGLFFEDINRSGDGGLYAEMVKNRSFDFPESFAGWQSIPDKFDFANSGVFQIINQSATNVDNPRYLHVDIERTGNFGIANAGFGRMVFEKNRKYYLTLVYRSSAPGLSLNALLINGSGMPIGNAHLLTEIGGEWRTLSAVIVSDESASDGRLQVSFIGKGNVDIDRISLFPEDLLTHESRALRGDLVQKLAEMRPGFFRFPGGCIVEGETLANRYQWKRTIGPLEERKLTFNKWNAAVPERRLSDYYQSFGLGFNEYFQLCEDLQTEPLPILNCGMSCQFDAAEVVPMDHLNPYIQDALDLIEFANGGAGTVWGAKRIALGHARPFHLKMIGIGNENFGPQYIERLNAFIRAMKAKYPDIKIVTSTGYSPMGQFKYMDSCLRKMNVDVIDEHYYKSPNWFLQNSNRYDNYDRKGPKIMLGEYAAQSDGVGSLKNKNTMQCALAEAAFMTGLERNADIVTLAAYAPLFAHIKDWQWTPNLIWFDNARSIATPSYYVQQLFSLNRGTHTASLLIDDKPVAGQDSIWASAVIDSIRKDIIIKVANPSSDGKRKSISLPSIAKSGKAMIAMIYARYPDEENTMESPKRITPVYSTIEYSNRTLRIELPPYSFQVIRIPLTGKIHLN